MLNNLINPRNILQGLLVFFLTATCTLAFTQEKSYTKPSLTDDWEDYEAAVKKDSIQRMLELKKIIPGIVYDLRYATVNNFMRRLMYPAGTKETYLRLLPAKALARVQAELNASGLGLKIYDAYRPYAVTEKFWELVKDERYVAHPAKGSGHNRGVAVDLTIIDLKTKKELDMGTGYDDFTDTAHHSFTNLSKTILTNRKMLKDLMEKHGFRMYNEEWWHYSWPDASRYAILDLPFKKFRKEIK